LIRFLPIERLNSVLVITSRPQYLEAARSWVKRLDQDKGIASRRLFIYHVQNGKAADLAQVLTQVFQEQGDRDTLSPAQLAPGLEPARISSQPGDQAPETSPAQPRGRTSMAAGEGLAGLEGTSIQIIADEINNALIIMATVQEYRVVEAALKRLDIVPLQVLIEATIAEITLTDELEYGLQWFFQNGLSRDYTGEGKLDFTIGDIVAPDLGFSYVIKAGEVVRAVLTALASESLVKIVASPALMVLNNQSAELRVGQQVPVQTSNQSSIAGESVLSAFEYRDTGVILSVTPRVNAGGLVTMEITQETTNVGAESGVGGNPIFTQRTIQSVVAVQSGETVVLGGLIQDEQRDSKRGVPGLYKLPVVGALFGETEDDKQRTELVVLLTPRAVRDSLDAQGVTDEFREKLEVLRPSDGSPIGTGAHGSSTSRTANRPYG
jgi:general secretion pathway protein D